MTIAQDKFLIPYDISEGLETGKYRRFGSVVRHSKGAEKGQIVKYLEVIESDDAHDSGELSQYTDQHLKELGIAAVGAAVVGLCWLGYTKIKNREPKVLKNFREALKVYIEAIRNGDMDINKINVLMRALDNLKNHKNYKEISIKLAADDFEILVGHIYDYTVKLAEYNNVELDKEKLGLNQCVILDLSSCLKAQQQIFSKAA